MPTKPWMLAPKRSLGIFSGISDVLDARDERAATLEKRLEREADRKSQGEMRTLDMALKQAELDARNRPQEPTVVATREDPTTGDVWDRLSNGTWRKAVIDGPPSARSAEPVAHEVGGEMPDQQAPAPQQQQPATLRLGVKQEKPPAKRTQAVKDHRGVMVAMDLDTGMGLDGKPIRAWQDAEKPVKSGIEALPQSQQNQLKLQQSAVMNLKGAISRLDAAVAKHGLELGPGEGRAAMDALMKEAQVQYKEAANLGVLNGPDLTLIEQALGNATNPMQLLRGGAKGVRASLKAARESLRSRARTMEAVYGVPMPAGFYDEEDAAPPAAAPGGVMPTVTPVATKPPTARNPWKP